jgi:hypothetical protein
MKRPIPFIFGVLLATAGLFVLGPKVAFGAILAAIGVYLLLLEE